MQYVLLTPIKNEEQFLPLLAEMLLRQTARPALWLLVNDASSDNSQTIIDELASAHDWVFSITMPFEPGGLGLHYARVVEHGFAVLQAEAARIGIGFDLIGKVDADVIFDADCFASLLTEFAADEQSGHCQPEL